MNLGLRLRALKNDGPPRAYLHHVDLVTRSADGWIPCAVVAGLLQGEFSDLYWLHDRTECQIWLTLNHVLITYKESEDEDDDEMIPGVERADIDAELNRRDEWRAEHRRQKQEQRARRRATSRRTR